MFSTRSVVKALQNPPKADENAYILECDAIMKLSKSQIRASYTATGQRKIYLLADEFIEIWCLENLKLLKKVPLPSSEHPEASKGWDSIFVIGNDILLNLSFQGQTLILNATTFEKVTEIADSRLQLATAQRYSGSTFFCQETELPIGLFELVEGKLRRLLSIATQHQLINQKFSLTTSDKLIIAGVFQKPRGETQIKAEVWEMKKSFELTKTLSIPSPKKVAHFSFKAIPNDLLIFNFLDSGKPLDTRMISLNSTRSKRPLPPTLTVSSASEFPLERTGDKLVAVNVKTNIEDYVLTDDISKIYPLSSETCLVELKSAKRMLLTLKPDPIKTKKEIHDARVLPNPLVSLTMQYLYGKQTLRDYSLLFFDGVTDKEDSVLKSDVRKPAKEVSCKH